MSRLKTLLRVANPSTCNTQQPLLQPCKAVAQHVHTTQQKLLHVAHASTGTTQQLATSPADELELLLAAVGPVYDTPAAQYAIIRATAAGDMAAALDLFRALAECHGVTVH